MPKVPKVTIGLVTFRGEKYLEYCIPSLLNQDYPNLEILIRDQSPNGEVYDYLKMEMSGAFEKAKIEKGDNFWHSGGHNALIRKMTGDYYLCCSNDMIYSHTLVSDMVREMEKKENQKYGSATCKLMRWNFKEAEADESGFTNQIDSFGLRLTKGHQFYDIGQGETDMGQYDDLKEVFGASGALAMYRKKALEDVKYRKEEGEEEYFDELLHYKNDVDLAYRLQWAGYPCLLVQDVQIYHDRHVGNQRSITAPIDKLMSHAKKTDWAKENSLFGHLVVIQKNRSPDFSLMVRFFTWLMNVTRWFHTAIFDRSLLKQYHLVSKHRNEIERRKLVMRKKVIAKTIEKLMK